MKHASVMKNITVNLKSTLIIHQYHIMYGNAVEQQTQNQCRGQFRWIGHLIKMPPRCLRGDPFWVDLELAGGITYHLWPGDPPGGARKHGSSTPLSLLPP